ncbi:riboflavin synthase [candidate division KSB1 bacterium]|nr:riboflavin synthase [candidate division KSB1 bacterium]
MFTGLVEYIGSVKEKKLLSDGLYLEITAAEICRDMTIGDSICVNGVCLTVVSFESNWFAVQAVQETVSRSNLRELERGKRVNLERALRADSRLGGHFVQGHIDCTGQVASIDPRHPGFWITISVPQKMDVFFVEKGSVAVDGVSLTIASKDSQKIAIAVIPHTFENTTLCERKIGDRVNIEVDILAKYVYHMLEPHNKNPITPDKLSQWGYE